MPKALSGSYLPFRKRKFYFMFGYTDQWYGKHLSGFTHVALAEEKGSRVIVFEPLMATCFTLIKPAPYHEMLQHYEVLEVRVKCTRANRLIRPIFQTCATFVQYIAGISTGALLCQTLYERLLYRKYEGIEVKKWELQP